MSSPQPPGNSSGNDDTGSHVTVRLPSVDWSAIDGTLDNCVSNGIDLNTPESDMLSRNAEVLRGALGGQIPWDDGRWPPQDLPVAISFTRSQWAILLECLATDMEVYESMGEPTAVEAIRSMMSEISSQL